MAKFVWQDGTLVSKAKVEVGGVIYEVDPEEYSGSTPLSASNLNAMVDSTYSDLKDYVDDKQTYSTEETVVGTWGGKPLYRKVIEISSFPNATETTYATGITNGELARYEGFVRLSSSDPTTKPLPYMSPGNTQGNIYYWVENDVTDVVIRPLNDRTSAFGKVIVEYTKTTD